MDPEKKRKVEDTVASVQDRWGTRALGRLYKTQTTPIPTGFPTLDEVLTIGGLPGGRISEFIGIPTSGLVTIGLKVIVQAQKKNSPAVYIDTSHSFDPDYAARCGLILKDLILVRPDNLHQALAIMQDLVLNGGIGILVFDLPIPPSTQAGISILNRMIAPLGQTNCVLLFLTTLPAESNPPSGNIPLEATSLEVANTYLSKRYPYPSTLPHYATIRLLIQREKWLYRQGDIHGYQAQVLVIKNKLGPAGRQVSISITITNTLPGSALGQSALGQSALGQSALGQSPLDQINLAWKRP